MKKYIYLSLLLISVVGQITISAQSSPPKREFRAVWIATVTNLDWPNTLTDVASQKQNLIDLLDSLKNDGINTVIFQVRDECDALYKSDIDPWSYYLTGQQGKAPSPFYDPLEFAVTEAHKRGMELHAWFNPYRVAVTIGAFTPASNHISKTHPEWCFSISTKSYLDPGLPMVRDYISTVISDVIRRYDIDGVHMDDYFYPYPSPGITNQDDSSFAKYSRGFTNRADWRRDNVNILIQALHDSIAVLKPYVKFGISPFGIWKSGTPAGISGMSSYSDIYCDPIAWLQKKSVDYLTPQLYWMIGGSQDYNKLSAWWADSVGANGRHFYPGMAPYRINSSSWSASELPNQIRINRANPKTSGNVFFRALTLNDNLKGFTDSLKNNLYRYPALRPNMAWKDQVKPNVPQNVRFDRIPGKAIAGLVWDKPAAAADSDTAFQYAVYRFTTGTVSASDLDNSANMEDIVGVKYLNSKKIDTLHPAYYVVTALDRNSNESAMSSILAVPAPAVPVLAAPVANAINQRDTIKLVWKFTANAGTYSVRVADNAAFTSPVIVSVGLTDTVLTITGLKGSTTYYWQVKASNAVGNSAYSAGNAFTTGFPVVVNLAEPAVSATNVSPNPVFKWAKISNATKYQIQIAKGYIGPTTIIKDTTITDTVFKAYNYELNTAYFWRVRAINDFGSGEWAAQRGFKTTVDVAESKVKVYSYDLRQNYPNPFNPSTAITFSVPSSANVRVAIYDVLGNEITVLADRNFQAGEHTLVWNAKTSLGASVPTGVYFYRMSAGNYVQVRKMMLVK